MLITQKWLIDNINLLRREMNEIARDYNQHVDGSKSEEVRKEVEFVRDVSSLRADHTILAQTQQQIVSMLKNSQLISGGSSHPAGDSEESNEIPAADSRPRRHRNREHLRRLISGLIKEERELKQETEKNVSQISQQVSALDELTHSLFRELNSMKEKLYNSSDD